MAQELPVSSPVDDFRQPRYSSSGNFETPSKRAPPKGRAGKSKRPEQDHYETDYTTGGESCDELEEDWIRYWVVSCWSLLRVCRFTWASPLWGFACQIGAGW